MIHALGSSKIDDALFVFGNLLKQSDKRNDEKAFICKSTLGKRNYPYTRKAWYHLRRAIEKLSISCYLFEAALFQINATIQYKTR